MNLGILRMFEGQVNSREQNHPMKLRNAYAYHANNYTEFE